MSNPATTSLQPPQIAPGLHNCADLLAFNCRPSRYLHCSWREEFVDPALSGFLFDGLYGHAQLSDYILQKMGISGHWCTDSLHPAVQIGMHLDEMQMHALACRLALTHVAVALPVRRAISRKAVADWRAALGVPLYRFVCKQAPLLGGAHFWDDVGWPVAVSEVSEKNIGGLLPALGYQFLSTCTDFLDIALAQRMRLKLPRHLAQARPTTIDIAHNQRNPRNRNNQKVWTWINRISRSMPTPVLPSITQDTMASTSIARPG